MADGGIIELTNGTISINGRTFKLENANGIFHFDPDSIDPNTITSIQYSPLVYLMEGEFSLVDPQVSTPDDALIINWNTEIEGYPHKLLIIKFKVDSEFTTISVAFVLTGEKEDGKDVYDYVSKWRGHIIDPHFMKTPEWKGYGKRLILLRYKNLYMLDHAMTVVRELFEGEDRDQAIKPSEVFIESESSTSGPYHIKVHP
jgi:hypothetical protein